MQLFIIIIIIIIVIINSLILITITITIIIIIVIIIIIIILKALLLVAPAYSVRADNDLLSKVSQSFALWYLHWCFFLTSKYQSQNPCCPQ